MHACRMPIGAFGRGGCVHLRILALALVALDGGVHRHATERRAPPLLPSADIALTLLRHGRDDQILWLAQNSQRGRTRAGQTISTMHDTRWRCCTSPVAFARCDDLCEKRHAQSDQPPVLPHTPKRQTPRVRIWIEVLSCCLLTRVSLLLGHPGPGPDQIAKERWRRCP